MKTRSQSHSIQQSKPQTYVSTDAQTRGLAKTNLTNFIYKPKIKGSCEESCMKCLHTHRH